MHELERVRDRIRRTVAEFCENQMGLRGEAVWIDLHTRCILVTVTAASSPAERDCARERGGRARIEKLYGDLYEASKERLEAAIAEIVAQPVARSRLSVDAGSGDCVIQFALAAERCECPGDNHRSPLP